MSRDWAFKKDPAKALEFYLASAKLGNGLAQNRLGKHLPEWRGRSPGF